MKQALKITTLFVSFLCTVSPQFAHAQLKDNIEVNLFGGGSFYARKNFEVGFPQTASVIGSSFTTAPERRARSRWVTRFAAACVSACMTAAIGVKNFFTAMNRARLASSGVHHLQPRLALTLGLTTTGLRHCIISTTMSRGMFAPSLASAWAARCITYHQRRSCIPGRHPFRGNLPGINNSNELALNYGVGIKTRASDWLGFRADIRGFLGDPANFGLPTESSDPNATVFPVSGAINNGEASAGVIFYFFNRR